MEKKKQIAEVKVKKPLKTKFKEAFKHEDVESIGDYVIFQVLIPHVLDAVADTIHSATDALFRDGVSSSSKKKEYYNIDRVSYHKSGSESRDYNNCKKVTTNDISDMFFKSRTDAITVLAELRAEIDDYGVTTVASLKELVGEDTDITDHNYGWTNLDSARPQASRGGYILAMPKPRYIK